MNIANLLTFVRFLLIPVFVYVLYGDGQGSIMAATSIFLFAGFTDILDGYVARKYNMITKWGQAMDPLADKLMQLTVLFCFTDKGILPLWVIVVIGIKELFMILGALILYYYKDKVVIQANHYGKFATVMMYVAILAVVLHLPFAIYIMVLAVCFTLLAFHNYVSGFKQIHKNIDA
ncbi:cardiolipin synthase [Anaerosolibacter carboniphilus]|uniref:CDP-diacylglycerol--glycerol-3-phosphate 3-phosphatidyltransferase n=1 Tax=Anaerosolibacter carboniphilus TaxID=1417629 RepID=A0A841KUH5_9FIRM|nr:CDP-diacylglycerol--glycerol-3-phosphate 3-phosphatidyltransferase [Anaerosolibacter carboniphilus]MBB6217091.1 cardiolipin synthase [Anaerosolibacter carboniphilus]